MDRRTHSLSPYCPAKWRSFGDIAAAPGQPAIDEATRRSSAFADRYASHYLAAVRCLTGTLPELTMHLRFPDEH
jgi:hypothetical protein